MVAGRELEPDGEDGDGAAAGRQVAADQQQGSGHIHAVPRELLGPRREEKYC